MDAQSRLRALYAVWTAFSIAIIALFSDTIVRGGEIGVLHLILAVVFALMGVLGTGLIFNWGDVPALDGRGSADDREKYKRTSSTKADAHLDMLDAETLEALRQRLQQREGDLPLNTLLGQDGELRRRS